MAHVLVRVDIVLCWEVIANVIELGVLELGMYMLPLCVFVVLGGVLFGVDYSLFFFGVLSFLSPNLLKRFLDRSTNPGRKSSSATIHRDGKRAILVQSLPPSQNPSEKEAAASPLRGSKQILLKREVQETRFFSFTPASPNPA